MPERRRALIIVECGLSVPSAMVRALQYAPHFEHSATWSARFESRRSPRLLRWLNRAHKPRIPLMVPVVHRLLKALVTWWERIHEARLVDMARNFDLVYLVKLPHLPLYQKLRALKGPRVVMDMNDGLWLPAFQAGDWGALDRILAASHAVICENDHVAAYARRHNPCVLVVPDSPQINLFDPWRDRITRDPAKVVLGWIGSPENVGALYRILEPLEALFARHENLHLRVVGAPAAILPRFENVHWSCLPSYDQEAMIRETLTFDIGLFPMFHNGDGLARGTLKAMIYMSAGAAVIAERYGENPGLIRDGANGVLAATPEEWREKLEWLVANPEARKSIARGGLETIRSGFTPEHVFSRLTAAFDRIMAGAA